MILHLGAAFQAGGPFTPEQYFDTNIKGTFNVLEAASGLGDSLRHVIVSSTDATMHKYPEDGIDDPIGIDTLPLDTTAWYGYSKILTEHLVDRYVRDEAMPATVFRYGFVFGAGEMVNFPQFHLRTFIDQLASSSDPEAAEVLAAMRAAYTGEPHLIVARDRHGRPWKKHTVEVRDIVHAYDRAVGNADTFGKVYQLGSAGRSPGTPSSPTWRRGSAPPIRPSTCRSRPPATSTTCRRLAGTSATTRRSRSGRWSTTPCASPATGRATSSPPSSEPSGQRSVLLGLLDELLLGEIAHAFGGLGRLLPLAPFLVIVHGLVGLGVLGQLAGGAYVRRGEGMGGVVARSLGTTGRALSPGGLRARQAEQQLLEQLLAGSASIHVHRHPSGPNANLRQHTRIGATCVECVSAVLIAIVLQTLTLGTVGFAAIHGLRQDLRDRSGHHHGGAAADSLVTTRYHT